MTRDGNAEEFAFHKPDVARNQLQRVELRQEIPLRPDAFRSRSEWIGFFAQFPRKNRRQRAQQGVGQRLQLPAEGAAQLPVGGGQRPFPAGVDQVHHRLRLAEVHPAVQKRPPGEFPRLRRPAAAGEEVAEDLLGDVGIAVAGDLQDILSGGRIGLGEKCGEDIVDNGHTLHYLRGMLGNRSPASLRAAVLLDKPYHRALDVPIDYTGLTCPDEFVVGYGLDYQERYRTLPYLAKLRPEVLPT